MKVSCTVKGYKMLWSTGKNKQETRFHCHSEAALSFLQLSDPICPDSCGSSSPAPIKATTPAGWWRPGCFGQNEKTSNSAAAPNAPLPATEGAARQRLAAELEVPAWEALVLVVGRVSCSRKNGEVGDRWPTGEGEVSINPGGDCGVNVNDKIHAWST
jgi:hypothetical protein